MVLSSCELMSSFVLALTCDIELVSSSAVLPHGCGDRDYSTLVTPCRTRAVSQPTASADGCGDLDCSILGPRIDGAGSDE